MPKLGLCAVRLQGVTSHPEPGEKIKNNKMYPGGAIIGCHWLKVSVTTVLVTTVSVATVSACNGCLFKKAKGTTLTYNPLEIYVWVCSLHHCVEVMLGAREKNDRTLCSSQERYGYKSITFFSPFSLHRFLAYLCDLFRPTCECKTRKCTRRALC